MRWLTVRSSALMLALAAALGFAMSAHAENAASISQGFQTKQAITQGTIVSLEKGSTPLIVPTQASNVNDMVGLVVQPSDTLLALSAQGTNIQVATSGVALALVTDLNGDVRAGDRIAISPIVGVGMRATVSGQILGTAQADFNSHSAGAKEVEVSEASGEKQKTFVGRIPVLIDIGYYDTKPVEQTVVPSSLQKIVEAISHKPVSTLRIIIALVLLILAITVVTVLIYSATRSSIISIGRNPLSQPAIRGSLLQVIGIAVGILLVTLISIYLIISR